MPSRKEECRRVGANVRTKARNVTSLAEGKRRYGANFKFATVTGLVVEVFVPSKRSGRQTSLRVDWDVGSENRRKEVKIWDIQGVENVQLPTCTKQRGPQECYVPDVGDSVQSTFELEVEGENAVLDRLIQSSPDAVWSHHMKWVENQIRISLNGLVLTRLWSVTNVHEMKIAENSGVSGLTPYDYFLWMFQCPTCKNLYHLRMCSSNFVDKNMTNCSQEFKFPRTILLMSQFQFGSRRDLWTTESKHKYVPAYKFGNTMPSSKFESLRRNI